VSYDDTQTHPTLIRNEVTKADGQQIILDTTKTWDTRWGLELSVTDPNDQTTEYAYDKFGRLTRTDFPDGGYTELIYNDYCAIIYSIFDSSVEYSNYTYVSMPRELGIEVRTGESQTEQSVVYFDGLGRKVQSVKTGEDGDKGRVNYG
jgi:YD repeat-containing protein